MARTPRLFRFITPQSASEDIKKDFWVKPCWDAEARVYYSESNIRGLHIEADTPDEFHSLARELAPEMIRDNHPQCTSGTFSILLEPPEGR